jgi:hypothetical protein
MKRSQYIKPSVLQLDFSTDEEVVSLTSCKSTTSSAGQILGGGQEGVSCAQSGCSSVSDS